MGLKNSAVYTLFAMVLAFANISDAGAQQPDTLWLKKIGPRQIYAGLEADTEGLPGAGKPTHSRLLAGSLETVWPPAPRVCSNLNSMEMPKHFIPCLGLDDSSGKNCSVILSVLADNKKVFKSPVMKRGSKAVEVNIPLRGVKQLSLVIEDNGTGLYNDRADYTNAFIAYRGTTPDAFNFNYINKRHILTPAESPKPKINGAKVFGVRPNHPFMFTIAATGKRPMSFAVENLPPGLSLDTKTGIITGIIKDKGESLVKLSVKNSLGTATRELRIVAGDRIALTPPMGWNGYNRLW